MMDTETRTDIVTKQKEAFRQRYQAVSPSGDPGGVDLDWGKIAALIRTSTPYRQATHLLVPPSSSFFQVRLNAIMDRKLLTVPSPGMQKGFQHFDPARIAPKDRLPAARLQVSGVRLTRDSYNSLLPRPVDLVIGEAFCAAEDGSLIGDGKGHLDLICGLLSTLRWLQSRAQVLAVVEESEILSTYPQEDYDVRAHWIVTPRGLFRTSQSAPPTRTIHWERLAERQIRRNEVLFFLATRLQKLQGRFFPITSPSKEFP